jgi:hypothetical protein
MYKKGERIEINIDDCRGTRVAPSRLLKKTSSLPQLNAQQQREPLPDRPAVQMSKNLAAKQRSSVAGSGGGGVVQRPESRNGRGSDGGASSPATVPTARQLSVVEPIPMLPTFNSVSVASPPTTATDNLTQRLEAMTISAVSPRPADAVIDARSSPLAQSIDDGTAPTSSEADLARCVGGWTYQPPPNNQRSFFFPEDGIAMTSEFDSGNLIQVERVAPMRYNMYSCPDCGNSPFQTNSKQWFHFALRGVTKNSTLHFTFIGQMPSKMYNFGWTPVACILPSKLSYTRISTRVNVTKLETMPPTPGYPDLVYKSYGDDDDGGPATSIPLGTPLGTDASGPEDFGSNAKKGPETVSVNVAFEYKSDVDVPLTSSTGFGGLGGPALYIASNHPYSFQKLQRSIVLWAQQAAELYFHKEALCYSLDGLPVDLLTISDNSGISQETEPSYDPLEPIPVSLAIQARAKVFPRKQYVVLSARVHPGEAPASHILQGSVDFLLSRTDPRAIELRKNFVFVVVPMLNPDGVVRGHSRADTCGQNLNRMYKNPSRQQHPAPYCLRKLLLSLQRTGRLALYVDMHAHANKRGAFFYGNGMKAEDQIQNVLYAKLVSLNTPHFDFVSSNFSEQNMFAVGKNGEGKDTSSRVTIFQETGFVHSYTIETSYVTGTIQNAIAALPMIPGEEIDVVPGMPSPKYNQATFADVGKGLLVALLDLKNMNPCSRLPSTSFRSTKGVAAWLQRSVLMELADFQRRQTALRNGLSVSTVVSDNSLAGLNAEEAPPVFTIRSSKTMPAITIHSIAALIEKEREPPPPQQPQQHHHQPSSAAARIGGGLSCAAKVGAVLPAARSSAPRLRGPVQAARNRL